MSHAYGEELTTDKEGKLNIEDHGQNCAKRKLTDVEYKRFLYESGVSNFLGNPDAVLVIVDMQLDFICGSLQVKGAYDNIDLIERLQRDFGYDRVLYTADNHPQDSTTFASNHEGVEPFTQFEDVGINADGKEVPIMRTAWPDHGVQKTKGQKIAVYVQDDDHVLNKGEDANAESYSGCVDDMGKPNKFKQGKHQGKTLAEVLKGKIAVVVGLAGDFCVGNTAADLKAAGIKEVVMPLNATSFVDLPGSKESKAPGSKDAMLGRLRAAGVKIMESIPLKFVSEKPPTGFRR